MLSATGLSSPSHNVTIRLADAVGVHQVVADTGRPPFGQGQVVLLIPNTIGEARGHHVGIRLL